jgi:hypothetical protein
MSNAEQRYQANLARTTNNAAMANDIAHTVGVDLAVKGYDKARATAFADRWIALPLAPSFWKGYRHGKQA